MWDVYVYGRYVCVCGGGMRSSVIEVMDMKIYMCVSVCVCVCVPEYKGQEECDGWKAISCGSSQSCRSVDKSDPINVQAHGYSENHRHKFFKNKQKRGIYNIAITIIYKSGM